MSDSAAKAAPKAAGRRNTEKTKSAILSAAQREFSQQGYSGARIDKIAQIAKCNVRMIYHYFDSKQKLYTTVLESMYAELRTREGSLEIDFDKPLEGLLKLLSFTFDYFEKNPSFEGILRAENVMRGRFVRRSARVSEMGFPLRRTITDLIASGQKQGILRHDLDAAQLYVTIAALSRFHHSSAFTLSAVLGTDISRPEWRKARWDHAQQMFIAYLISTGDVSALPAVAQEPDIAAKPTRKPRSAKAAQTAEPQAPALAAEPQT